MAKLSERLWNWGHLEGSHNQILGEDCTMSPEMFAKEYGIERAFIVSYGGNIQPPYDSLASRLSGLKEIIWSVLGDSSTPLPEHELGNVPDVINVKSAFHNIRGGVVDDFFSPKRLKRFTPAVLKKMKKSLSENGLSFWSVLYAHELQVIGEYVDCFDGITFWLWKSEEIADMDEKLDTLFSIVGDKPVMLGIYLWDYASSKAMDPQLFTMQINRYLELLRQKRIEGIVFCSGAIGDADLETNKILKNIVREYGDEEI